MTSGTEGKNEEEHGKGDDTIEPVLTAAASKLASTAIDESSGLFKRVLGPPADAVGDFLKQYVTIKTRNSIRVAEAADSILARRNIASTRAVPFRTAAYIFDQAVYLDDTNELVTEYLGGILASARSASDRAGDTASQFAAVVARMATDQLKLHYCIYRCMHHAFQGRPRRLLHLNASRECYIPAATLTAALGSAAIEDLWSPLHWLHRDRLVSEFAAMQPDGLSTRLPPQSGDVGISVRPSSLGMELFLWGLGYPVSPEQFWVIPSEGFAVASLEFPLGGVEPFSKLSSDQDD